MILRRSVVRFLSSSSSSCEPAFPAILRAAAAVHSARFSTEASPAKRLYKRKSAAKAVETNPEAAPADDQGVPDSPRPPEMPFQPKVANSVHLIGNIGIPVQPRLTPDGFSAVSTLVRNKLADLPTFQIPIVFDGDLAHIAACHLKENDLVYVTGQLSADGEPMKLDNASANVQVLVRTLNFVQEPGTGHALDEVEQSDPYNASVGEDTSLDLWNNLLENPEKWWDNRINKLDPKYPDFKHKQTGEKLWIKESTPEWVVTKLAFLFGEGIPKSNQKIGIQKKLEIESLWSDLVTNPQQWSDIREKKQNGMVNAKYPDFKKKNASSALWLNTAPSWVVSRLDGLEFSQNEMPTRQSSSSTTSFKPKSVRPDDAEDWKDLVGNPRSWWDNRSSKLKPNQPDFKHKENGKALWLNSAPSWVPAKLPQPMPSKTSSVYKNAA